MCVFCLSVDIWKEEPNFTREKHISLSLLNNGICYQHLFFQYDIISCLTILIIDYDRSRLKFKFFDSPPEIALETTNQRRPGCLFAGRPRDVRLPPMPLIRRRSGGGRWSKFEIFYGDTVDGWNPAPPRMMIIPLFIGFQPSQVVVWNFSHQQYGARCNPVQRINLENPQKSNM